MGLIDYKSVSVTSSTISAFDKDSSNYISQYVAFIQGDSQMSDNSGGGCKNYLTLFIDRMPVFPGSDENFKSSAGISSKWSLKTKLLNPHIERFSINLRCKLNVFLPSLTQDTCSNAQRIRYLVVSTQIHTEAFYSLVTIERELSNISYKCPV